jgi:hypothetical protein
MYRETLAELLEAVDHNSRFTYPWLKRLAETPGKPAIVLGEAWQAVQAARRWLNIDDSLLVCCYEKLAKTLPMGEGQR